MFKLFQNAINNKFQPLSSVYTVSVRWATKPRWVPIAKTKKFRVPPRRAYPPEDMAEVKRLFNKYRTEMKAIISVIKESYRESATSDEVIAKREKDIQDSWDECMRINDEWNKNVALEREERNKQEFEKEIQRAREKMAKMDAARAETQKRVDQLIREQQELSKTFITEKNIDAHIQKILNEEPHTFLWAMDLKGNIYEGYNKQPNPRKTLIDGKVVEKSESKLNQAKITS